MKWIDLYPKLPRVLQTAAASMHGFRLRWRRYGREFRRALPGAVARMSWGRRELDEYSERQVRRLMQVVPHVPFYRQQFARLGIDAGRIESTAALTDLAPVTKRSMVKERPASLLDERLRPERLIEVHTSGTTGSPLTLYRNERAEGMIYAYAESRWRLPYGVDYRSSWTNLGGQRIVPLSRTKPPFWVWNAGLNQRYMSRLHLGPRYASAYTEELRRSPTTYLYGSAPALSLLARMVQQTGGDDISFKVVISSAAPLYEHQRRLISEVFHCPVRDTYGCVEGCVFGFECEEGRMHVSTDAGLLEILDEGGGHCTPGEVGDVVCTGFLNLAQPLIRYNVGDRAAWAEEQQCACGCAFPVLASIDGRQEDFVILKDGRRLGTLNNLFKADLPIVEAQVVQDSRCEFTFRIVPAAGWSAQCGRELEREARSYLGDARINVECVEVIPREASGKFRAVISNVKGVADGLLAGPQDTTDGIR